MPETIESPPKIVPPTPAEPEFKEMLDNLLKKKPEESEKTGKPAMWAVVLHNDNTTFPNFVVEVLREACKIEGSKASEVMMNAHKKGSSVVTVTTKDNAETMLRNTQEMTAKAEAGRDFWLHAGHCELTFTIQEDSPAEGGGS